MSRADRIFRETICLACDFYKPGDALECAGFKVLKYFVETGRLTLEEIEIAVSLSCKENSAQEVRK